MQRRKQVPSSSKHIMLRYKKVSFTKGNNSSRKGQFRISCNQRRNKGSVKNL